MKNYLRALKAVLKLSEILKRLLFYTMMFSSHYLQVGQGSFESVFIKGRLKSVETSAESNKGN